MLDQAAATLRTEFWAKLMMVAGRRCRPGSTAILAPPVPDLSIPVSRFGS